ncbi:MAG TPA: transcription termination/antitermination factor NusG [Candidatus Omnitrophica bacterium]|nr:transcription termination/antitermination factor NusG [Candidatus Omnitrophota bacterium]
MKKWYVVHTQTGAEDKVKISLEGRISSSGLNEEITRLLIPTEQVAEIRSGKKRISERKFFPGYLLVEMDLTERAYLVIKGTPGVTGFIGVGKKPMPLPDTEVESILKRTEETQVKPSPKTVFDQGEQVRVTDGPFVNFNGTIEEIYPEKGKIKVSVSIFGRSTPVELEYWQVEKV